MPHVSSPNPEHGAPPDEARAPDDGFAPRPDEVAAAQVLDLASGTDMPKPREPKSANGHKPGGSFEAKLIADLDGAIREKRDEALGLERGIERTRQHLLDVRATLKRYEDMRKRLLGEPLRAGRPKSSTAGPSPTGRWVGRYPTRGKNVSAETLAEVRAAIERYAETHEEFRQVDIRALLTGRAANTGTMATAFEALRQEGMIRFARQAGNAKYFRLTRSEVAK